MKHSTWHEQGTSRAPPSVARGLALLAGLALGVTALRSLGQSFRKPPAAAVVCDRPVEVADAAGWRLGCADGWQDAGCAEARSGARVVRAGGGVGARTCRVQNGAMSGQARLVSRLPLLLNRATVADLTLLPAIGPKRAAVIVADREARGPFGRVDELRRVHGIGPTLLRRLAPWLSVAPADTRERTGERL